MPIGAGVMLIAYMAFKQPNKIRMAYLIPKDKTAWLEYLVHLAKKKTVVKYLSDKELRKVILRARPSLLRKKYTYPKDKDTPESHYWSEKQVADWVEEVGYPHLKDAFLLNCINGRKLIDVDASALNKMGMTDFDEIKNLAVDIRRILEINRPNILRAIARMVPLKLYLQRRVRTGRTYDLLTFKKFCENNGFPYDVVVTNKCALIPCTCSVIIRSVEQEMDSSGESEGSSTDLSLVNAPSVEYLVRHQVARNKTIASIIEELLQRYSNPKYQRMFGPASDRLMQRIMDDGFLELGFSDPASYTKEKVAFATEVSDELIKELLRSVEVLNDMNKFRQELREENISEEHFEDVRKAAEMFLEDTIPIAASLLLGCYSLENIFKEQPEFIEYVNTITEEAERKTNEQTPLAVVFVDHILSEAKLSVMQHEDFPYLSLEILRPAKKMATELLDELLLDSTYIANSLLRSGIRSSWDWNELTPEVLQELREKRKESIQRRAFLNSYVPPLEQHQNSPNIAYEMKEERRSREDKIIIPIQAKQEQESEWVELPRKARPDRPASAPAPVSAHAAGIVRSIGKSSLKLPKPESHLAQHQLPEGQQVNFSVSHVVVETEEKKDRTSQTKRRSELTSILSKHSRHSSATRPSSATSIPSRNVSTFEQKISASATVARVHSENEHTSFDIPRQIFPKLSLKKGLIYDKFEQVVGELKEDGRIVLADGSIVGHVAENGVAFSPTGGVIGKINMGEDDEAKARRLTKSTAGAGYRVGLGPIKADQYYLSEKKSYGKAKSRPVTASAAYRRPQTVTTTQPQTQKQVSRALRPSVVAREILKTEMRSSLAAGAETEDAAPVDLWSSSHSIHHVDDITNPWNKDKINAYTGQRTEKQVRPSSVPAKWFHREIIGHEGHPVDIHRPAGENQNRLQSTESIQKLPAIPDQGNRTDGEYRRGSKILRLHPDENHHDIYRRESRFEIQHRELRPTISQIEFYKEPHQRTGEHRNELRPGESGLGIHLGETLHEQHIRESRGVHHKIRPGEGHETYHEHHRRGSSGERHLGENHFAIHPRENLKTQRGIHLGQFEASETTGHGLHGHPHESTFDVTDKLHAYGSNERQNLWDNINSGIVKRIIGHNGLILGEVQLNGKLFGDHGKVIGYIHQSGTLVHENGEIFMNAMTATREDGVVVGKVENNGKIRLLEEKDHPIIGKVQKDGQILAANGTVFGHIIEGGRIFGENGLELGYVTNGRLYGMNGLIFGFISENGMIRKYDVTPQKIVHNHPKQIEVLLKTQHSPVIIAPSGIERLNALPLKDKMKAHAKMGIVSSRFFKRPSTALPPPRHDRTYNAEDQNKYNALLGGENRQHLQGVHEIKSKKEHIRPSTVPQDLAEEPLSPTNSIDENAPDEIHLRKLHRREMVEKWAQDLEGIEKQNAQGNNAAQRRVIRMTADQIVADVLQMALTHLLLQAEAGQDTEKVLKALKMIQLKATSNDEDTTGLSQILWIPNLPGEKAKNLPATQQELKMATKDAVLATLKGGVTQMLKQQPDKRTPSPDFY